MVPCLPDSRRMYSAAGIIILFLSARWVTALVAGPSTADWLRFSVLTPAGPAEPDADAVRRIRPLVYARHRIGPNEWNAWKIAKQYGTTITSLQSTNSNELNYLRPGSELTVFNKTGRLYEVTKDQESLDELAVQLTKDPAQVKRVKEAIVEANELPGTALIAPYEFFKGEKVLEPGVGVIVDSYHLPVEGRIRISSGFGMRYHPLLHYKRMHDGWDLAKPYGTPVYAARDGRVVFTGWKGGYGNAVVIQHVDGWKTIYGHLSKIDAHEGQRVVRGATLIGKVGSTGISTGPHLHFEMRDPGDHPVNPGKAIARSGPIHLILHLAKKAMARR